MSDKPISIPGVDSKGNPKGYKPTGECTHDLSEREASVYADGLCPICLQQQLADEREAWATNGLNAVAGKEREIAELEHQLTAAIAVQQPLVDALDDLIDNMNRESRERAMDALAKVKEWE